MEELRRQLEMLNRAMLPSAPQSHAALQESSEMPEGSSNPFAGPSIGTGAPSQQHSSTRAQHSPSGNPGQTSGIISMRHDDEAGVKSNAPFSTSGSGSRQHASVTAAASVRTEAAAAMARARHVSVGNAGVVRGQRQYVHGPASVSLANGAPTADVAVQPKQTGGRKAAEGGREAEQPAPLLSHDSRHGKSSYPFAGFDT